jgi:hypothetical protein
MYPAVLGRLTKVAQVPPVRCMRASVAQSGTLNPA